MIEEPEGEERARNDSARAVLKQYG
jgi:hypothetical protein